MRIGWINYSKEDQNLARRAEELMKDSEARDELGLSSIRDGFSNLFFPGTASQFRRAKYYFIVPYACIQLKDEINTDGYRKKLNQKEKEDAKAMYHNMKRNEQKEDEKVIGLIGSNGFRDGKDKWVKTPPSDLCWASLRSVGIFLKEDSKAEYIRNLCEANRVRIKSNDGKLKGKKRGYEGSDYDLDGRNEEPTLISDYWDSYFMNHKNWNYYDNAQKMKIELTPMEKKYLREKFFAIDTYEDGSYNLMQYLLERNNKALRADDFMSLKEDLKDCPKYLKDQYQLAYQASEFVYLLMIRYNLLIGTEEANDEWEEEKNNVKRIARNLNLDKTFTCLKLNKNGKHGDLYRFLQKTRELFIKNDLKKVDKEIESREKQVKQSKMRIGNNKDTKTWHGGKYLDYRYSVARQIMMDILEGEKDVRKG